MRLAVAGVTDVIPQSEAFARLRVLMMAASSLGRLSAVDDLSVLWGALALSLFHHLKRDAIRAALQAVTREYWGSVISDESLIRRLLDWGIQVPQYPIQKAG